LWATEQAIPTNFPENDAWPMSGTGLPAAVFRDGGPVTFPKSGLLGRVSSSFLFIKTLSPYQPQLM